MSRTPDRSPGALEEDEELRFTSPSGSTPSINGAMTYDPAVSEFKMRDGLGTFNPRSAGSGISAGTHRTLDQLVHDVAETSYEQVIRSSGQVTDDIIWTNSGMTQKVRETTITRSGGQIDTIVVKQYDGAGSLVETLTGTVTRVSGQVDTIDWVLT